MEKGRYVHAYVDTDMTCVMDKRFKVNFEQNTQHRLKYNAGYEDMDNFVNYKIHQVCRRICIVIQQIDLLKNAFVVHP